MTAWYWVSYTIVNGSNGAANGHGSSELELTGPPATAADVQRLGEDITRASHADGKLIGCYAHVMAWSKMGDR